VLDRLAPSRMPSFGEVASSQASSLCASGSAARGRCVGDVEERALGGAGARMQAAALEIGESRRGSSRIASLRSRWPSAARSSAKRKGRGGSARTRPPIHREVGRVVLDRAGVAAGARCASPREQRRRMARVDLQRLVEIAKSRSRESPRTV